MSISKLIALRGRLALGLVVVLLITPAPSAAAAPAPGGIGAGASVALTDVACVSQCVGTHRAMPGSTVRVRGLAMEQVSQVIFRGATGPIAVAPQRSTETVATVVVPGGALASRPYVMDAAGEKSDRSPHKLFIVAAGEVPAAVYPLSGSHELLEGIGSGRDHQGADIGAACGTPLVAALPGRVEYNKYEPRAGNYLVIDVEGIDADIIYMHLRAPSPLRVGLPVAVGQSVGTVGDTGNATACLLHFEYWIGEAWRGGEPVDPVPYLEQWEAETRSASAPG